jgi:hypothetical protein
MTGMHALYVGPGWFYGIENIFNVFSIIVCLLLFFFCWKIYKLTLNNNYKVFSYSFLLFALSFIIQVATHFAMYMAFRNIRPFEGIATLTSAVSVVHIGQLYVHGYFWMMLTFLLGLLFLLVITLRVVQRRVLALLSFFVLLATAYASNTHFVFHLTAAFMILVVLFFFCENCVKKKTLSAKLVAIAFGALFLSQIAFVFEASIIYLYTIGNLLQLLGFIALLVNYIKILKK